MKHMLSICASILIPCAFAADDFINHGIGANIAEARGAAVIQTKDGRQLILANAVDTGPTAYIVVINVNDGKSKSVYTRKGIGHGTGAFGSLMSSNGKFYTGRGNIFLEFDPVSMTWSYEHKLPNGSYHIMNITESENGRFVWAACYPNAMLVKFDTVSREFTSFGQLDPTEQYPGKMAFANDGWAYSGLGTSRANIVAFNTKTGEIKSVIDDSIRNLTGTAVVRQLTDGRIVGQVASRSFFLNGGNATPVPPKTKLPPYAATGTLYYGETNNMLPDGKVVQQLDFNEKNFILVNKDGTKRKVSFDYNSSGTEITSLVAGPNGILYASTAHPFRFVRFNPAEPDNKPHDLGGNRIIDGGNMCALASLNNHLYGAEYAGGRLWDFDTNKPYSQSATRFPYTVLGLNGAELVNASLKNPTSRVKLLADLNVAFVITNGDDGAMADFALNAPADGSFYLKFAPYHYSTYCDVQYFFDGQPVGKPYNASKPLPTPETLSYGPFNLKAGNHTFSLKLLNTPGRKQFCSLIAASLQTDPNKPLLQKNDETLNPVILAQWSKDICRPRACLAHPDKRHILYAGYANYGFCGGGIGIHDIQTGENTLLTADKDLLPAQSCVTLKALPNGDLIGGTDIAAPGGGKKTATTGEIFILDWKTRKIAWHGAPVPSSNCVWQLHVTPAGKVLGLARPCTFFVFDPESRKVILTKNWSKYGGIPGHLSFIPDSESGRLFVLLTTTILQLDQNTFQESVVADKLPASAAVGGACVNGRLYYANTANIFSWKLPK